MVDRSTRTYYLNPWWSEHHSFASPLSPDECRAILDNSTTTFLGRSVGRNLLTDRRYVLFKRPRLWTGIEPAAYVRLVEATGGGTSVDVVIQSSRNFRVFAGVALALPVIALGETAFGRGAVQDYRVVILEFVFFTGAVLFYTVFSRRRGRDDPAFLSQFLAESLRLRQVE